MSDENLKRMALDYHRYPIPGKLEIAATKPLGNQLDLALAYSPGVAAACEAIVDDPAEAAFMTGRQNLVAVISNGTAVLGLGAIGPLASKPVMEGKAVLFKKFAGINVFDIEVDEMDPDKLVDIICALEPTFGAVNLEDIKAPECFVVEKKCRERMNIPVFHDDQHGTAIVTGAAILNGLRVIDKKFEDIKLVSTGGGSAGIACLNLLLTMGVKRENVWLVDHLGVIYEGRKEEMNPEKASYAQKTDARTLDDVIDDADVFLGLSAGGILKPDMVKKMSAKPLILALANPVSEIDPDEAKKANPNAVIATGRSDYPNQVNNVLCFPFIFRGALDVGATTINEEMKIAAVRAIADLATAESSEVVAQAYKGEELKFGADYLIPKPFDLRLIVEVASAVARAAMDSGVATQPIEDFELYREKLGRFVFRSGMLMKPIFERACQEKKRLVFAEGEDERVLRAIQVVVDDGIADPILIGRPDVIAKRIENLGLRIQEGRDFSLTNPESDPRYDEYWRGYHEIMRREGVSPDLARTIIRTNSTVIASMMMHRGEADAMICGTYGHYAWHVGHVLDVIGKAEGVRDVSALSCLIVNKGTFFMCDTHVTHDPSMEEIVETTIMGADAVRRFGLEPKVALISHSNFGNDTTPTAIKMREAVKILRERVPDLEVDGEMHADAALDQANRDRVFPGSCLTGVANLLVFPNLEAANGAFNLLKAAGDGLPVGPLLVGAAKPVHVVTTSISARGLVNMSALAVVDAQARQNQGTFL
ncbi:MAG: NADP-dependent malic enzyme [Rhodospirillaceae bacterium]|nr:NADP-dependent malic enzyme [Rhodospirillaceae bacterium]MBT5299458.1 NADP-dependent malic enzyme [Rhodospirillaceae bacterium]MBT5515416.1 NADP-dependent malic enzyme [Rhodospirillaceae bacterium]MBT6085819.1 NADP-dependent malic enzyme [Rhodospirillaceae bacterium]MBT6886379.1 NADP-dependent malic enzyme [Rhodospirillaceae bacterium]